MSVVELGPVVKTVDVRRSARDAFRIFTSEMSSWWPMATHTRAKTAVGEVTVKITVEPRIGGRVYETLSDGRELEWAVITAFEPGALFAMEWRLGRPDPQYTDVSVKFEPLSAEATRVTLTHENWQRMGGEAERLHEGYNNGWQTVLIKGFGDYAGKVS